MNVSNPCASAPDSVPGSACDATAGRARRTALRRLAVLAFAGAAAGCGFKLRGSANIPFETMVVQGADNTAFAVELKRSILANRNVRIVDDPKQAQAILQIAGITQERRILSLSGAGRVREFQLVYRVSYRVHDGKGREFIPPGEVVLRRDITFNDSQVLAKEQEEILLVRDMQNDAVQQLMRRLSAARLSAS
ncbi:MAG: LPS assembly lipoprotein LptE [bacterium]|jgi:LPS-assembly lipoprotein